MEFIRPTDQKHIIQCESRINHVTWGSTCASAGESTKLDIGTSFMGLGSEIKLAFKDQRGKTVLVLTKPVYADRVSTSIDIPEKIKAHLICEATLSTNGKSLQSQPLTIVAPRSVHELTWSQTSVRRGDAVTLKAKTHGFVSGTHVIIHIYEYDQFGAHLPAGELFTNIKNDVIEVMWQFQYKGKTKDILTEADRAEQNKHYQAPSFFWVAEVDGRYYGLNKNSGLLAFDKNDIELNLQGYRGLTNSNYVITLADGKKVKGTLAADGLVKLSDVAPGPVQFKMTNLASITAQPMPEIMPKGSIPLPSKIPNYQVQAANAPQFTKGWGWRRFPLLGRAGLLAALPFLTTGGTRVAAWKEAGYDYMHYLEQNVIVISKDQKRLVALQIQGNDVIEIIGETPEHTFIHGATVGVINEQGVIATIVAALDNNQYLRWRLYKANGGKESFVVWFSSGQPLDVEVEYPVRVRDKKLLPRVDTSDKFSVKQYSDGSRMYRYGNPDDIHGLEVHVDPDGVLGFNIRAQGDSVIHGSGRDMFNSVMLRLKQDNVKVNQIRGYWESGSDSINFSQFSNNIKSTTPEQAARNTWTGQLAKDHGFEKVISIKERFGDVIVIFGNC